MKPNVQLKLDAIFGYPFFRSCGERLPKEVTAVDGWQVAVKTCNTRKWENCRLMARNALQRFTAQRAWERSEEWNPLADELRPLIDAFVDDLLPKTCVPEQLAGKIRNDVRWDIMLICFEHEYCDVVEPIFYVPYLEPWYAAGHFPCGWDGQEFPAHWDGVIREGRLVVF